MPLPHLKRTLECSTPGTRLSVKYGQLVIKRPNLPTTSVPIEEIGMIVIDDGRATVTQQVLASLAESSAAVVVTGTNHMPVGIMLPIQGHSAPIPIQRKQIELSEPRRKQLWKSIVQSKIRQQSLVLQHFNGEDAGISSLTKKVLSGDTSNVEAQAAQRYWPLLFGASFRRNRTLPGVNALLNYGYAIVRATVARALVSTGLHPSFGLHHHHRSNAFCLADDLLEPYRPFVDHRVKAIADDNSKSASLSLDDRSIRSQLLSIPARRISINQVSTPLSLAIGMSATSLRRCVVDREEKLLLPSSRFFRKRDLPQPLASTESSHDTRKSA